MNNKSQPNDPNNNDDSNINEENKDMDIEDNKYIDYVNKDYTPIQKLEAQYLNLFKVIYNKIIKK